MFRLIPVVLLLLTAMLSIQVHASESFKVEEIKLEGLEKISDGTLLNYLPVRVGDVLDDNKIVFAIKELYKTGFFTNVKLLKDANTLVVRVEESPSISEINIEGNTDIDDDMLKDTMKDIGLVKGLLYNRSMLDQLTQDIERVYFAQGKYGVKIDTEIKELEKNRVEININISEGDVALIRDINIIGNHVFNDDILLDEIELSAPDDEYSKPKLNADLEKIRSFYLDRGYIKFKISSTQVSITPDKKDIYITINIEEGEQYKLSDVALKGKLIFDRKEMEGLILTKKGEPFSRRLMTETQNALETKVGKIGYAFARVSIDPQIDDQSRTMSLTYTLDPGYKVFVRNIHFKGNYRTQDEVLRRELRLSEGSVLDSEKLSRSKVRLQRLSYLGDINIEPVKVPGTNDQVDLEVSVVEELSGSFNIGAGYSQSQGFLFNVGLSQENLFGTGQSLRLTINTDDANTIYNMSFTDPYYTIDGISRTFNLTYRDRDAAEEDIINYQTDIYDASVTYGIPLSEYNTVRLGYGISHVEITLSDINPSDAATAYVDEFGDEFDNFMLSASFSHDTRNRTVFANEGSSQSLGIRFSTPGSDLEFYKLSYNTKFYFGITDDVTFLLRSRLAYGDGYKDTEELPFFERYYAGGLRTVRGFESNSLGPRDTGGDPGDPPVPIGGNMLITAGGDLIFPIPFVEKAPRSVRLSLFYDIGNVFLDGVPTYDSTEEGYDSDQLRSSTGISFVWLAPIGPLRFSWARAIEDKPGDELKTFQFSIGSFF